LQQVDKGKVGFNKGFTQGVFPAYFVPLLPEKSSSGYRFNLVFYIGTDYKSAPARVFDIGTDNKSASNGI
jgi:hypothetical protein